MPEYALWTLIISLAILSFGMTLKIANFKHALKLLEKENNRFIEEITMVKQNKDKAMFALSVEFLKVSVFSIGYQYSKILLKVIHINCSKDLIIFSTFNANIAKDKAISGLSERHNTIMNKLIQKYETQIKYNLENTDQILKKYQRLVPPAKLAFLEHWDNKNNTPNIMKK